jgi:3-dehydroquinate synthase
MIKSVRVGLRTNAYPIYIGQGTLARLGRYIESAGLQGTAFIVTQSDIWKHWGKPVQDALNEFNIDYKVYLTPARLKSEQCKSFDSLKEVLKHAAILEMKGKGLFFVAVGGGVIGDLTGFAASVYKRGTPVIQIPTTLTAQVDSAIGGKTAVDLPQAKNLAGTIHQPKFVLADPVILKTLPELIFRDGLAEVIKYACISDAKLFETLQKQNDKILSRDANTLERIITTCCKIKASVVSRDERDDRGVRAVLNFGHTLGHAIEAAAGYKLYTHGQAISIGMVMASELSFALQIMKRRENVDAIRNLLIDYGLPVRLSAKVKYKKISQALLYDKKRVAGSNRWIVLRDIGRALVYRNVPDGLIHQNIGKVYEGKVRAGDGILKMIFTPSRKAVGVPELPPGKAIGSVVSYYAKISVAIVKITKGEIRIGDKLKFQGNRANFEADVQSLQIHKKAVESAKRGEIIGMKVPKRVRAGDLVFKI